MAEVETEKKHAGDGVIGLSGTDTDGHSQLHTHTLLSC